jgi:DNA-binding transcriptional MocR family regulator
VELTPPVARYEQVARFLRRQILDGEIAAGAVLPGAPALARQKGVTQSVANRALETLEALGMVRMEAGRGSVVLEQRRWHVTVTVRQAAGEAGIPPEALSSAVTALEAAAGTDPAVEDLSASYVLIPATHDTPGWPALATEMTVLAADVGIAGVRAWGLVRDALRAQDGWDLDEPWASARPASAEPAGEA